MQEQQTDEMTALRERVTELEKLLQQVIAAQSIQIALMTSCMQDYQQTITRLTARYASQNTPEKWWLKK